MVLALPLAMDIYVPAVPKIAEMFHVSAGRMQLTLTLFMFVAGIMQLVVGPLSDQFGRKPISILTIIIFSLGTYLCSMATSSTQLISFRAIQAIGACGMLVVSFANVRDLYSGEQSAQIYSFLNGMISFSPMFAPFIGGYLEVKYGWPETFLALLVIALLAFITMGFMIEETLPADQRHQFRWRIFSEYYQIGKNPIFLYYTIATGIGLSYLYLFCSISPYIIIRQLHIPVIHYGYYFCFMGISFFVGSFVSAFIVKRLGIFKTVYLGFILTLIGGILMTAWYFITGLTIDNFIWPMLLIGMGGTFSMGAGNGGAMEPFEREAGRAAALSGSFRFIFSSIVGAIVITNHLKSTLPLAIPAILFSLIGIAYFMYFRAILDFRLKT